MLLGREREREISCTTHPDTTGCDIRSWKGRPGDTPFTSTVVSNVHSKETTIGGFDRCDGVVKSVWLFKVHNLFGTVEQREILSAGKLP